MRYFLLVLSFIAISGCGYKEGVTTAAQKSYLYFTGNTENVKVSVDGGKQFSVESGRDNQYKIEPGKHVVKVYRDNEVVVEKLIFVGESVAKEIELE